METMIKFKNKTEYRQQMNNKTVSEKEQVGLKLIRPWPCYLPINNYAVIIRNKK